jgi:hypothetical protein
MWILSRLGHRVDILKPNDGFFNKWLCAAQAAQFRAPAAHWLRLIPSVRRINLARFF